MPIWLATATRAQLERLGSKARAAAAGQRWDDLRKGRVVCAEIGEYREPKLGFVPVSRLGHRAAHAAFRMTILATG